MHPEQTSDKPGMCPECHMALEKPKKKQEAEHGNHDSHNPNIFKQKFWVSLVLSLPVLYFSKTIQELVGFDPISFSSSQYIPALLGVILFAYGGMVFLRSARYEIAAKKPGMMTLISLAISVAFIYSLLITLGIFTGMDFWWELVSLITIMLLGHWLEMASVENAQGALKELAKLLPDEAELVTKTGTETISLCHIKRNDNVLVRPGAKIPTDGVVVKGESNVNEALLTGESAPVKKVAGDMVIAGAINRSGSLTVKVIKTGDDTTLSGIMRLVSEAQKSKSKTQLLADKAAGYLFYYSISAAFITTICWMLLGANTGFIIERVVAVLIIACPHALGLAIPLVTAISTTKAAKAGLLVRERSALENARKVDVILFDKTGTLTRGEQGVVTIIADNKSEAIRIAASVESDSEHPIAKAITDYAKSQDSIIDNVNKFNSIEGRGVSAVIDGVTYFVGGPQLLKEKNIQLTAKYKKSATKAANNGHSVIYVLEQKKLLGCFVIADVLRDESKAAVASLRRSGLRVAMVTGDSEGVAVDIAKKLHITDYFAEVLPENKVDVVRSLQEQGLMVAMVGDGVNDAPALTAADIGIAIGAGTDVAIESAGIVLASNDPTGVARIITLSQKTYNKMVQNLFWAAGYNIIAVPLAGGALAFTGFILSPAVGAALMSLSTIIVAVNAQLLREVEL
jgi:Cu2+-exporting ATPase